MSHCFLLSIWMVSQVFCVIYVYGSSWFFLVALVNSKFLYFSASSFVKTVSVSPQGTRTPNRWIESPRFSRLNWRGSNRGMSHCFVLLVWSLTSFLESYTFAALRDSFWIALVNSEFLFFPASRFVKTGRFSPQPTRTLNRWVESSTLSRLS